MKVTQQLEKEIRQLMDDCWSSYFNGDLETYASYLLEDYKNIGTTQEEIWNSRDEILEYTTGIRPQLDSAQIRNKDVRVIPMDPYLMVHEFGDIFVKAENGWSFYAPFRLSSVLQQVDGSWKIAHQHGSYPDSRTQQGEAFAFDEVLAENKKLQAAVARRTEELEQKTRELEIEAALERVRAQAMAIRKPQDLAGISEIVFTELMSLGFTDLRNTEVIINNKTSETIRSYYYSDYGVTGEIEVYYKEHPTVKTWAEEMQRANDGFAKVVITEDEIASWREYRQEIGYLPDPKLDEADSVYYYSYSTGLGALSISAFTPVSDDQITTLERFRNVFGLAYRRYLDVAKAEAQTREAQIEAALERVRARSMAMHHSHQLSEVIEQVFAEFQQLGFDALAADLMIFNRETKEFDIWISGTDGTEGPFCSPDLDHPHHRDTIRAWEQGEKVRITELKGDFFHSFFQIALDETRGLKSMKKETRKEIMSLGHMVHTEVFTRHGCIRLASLVPRTEEQLAIQKRFARVFQQTYTRFLDLQKAEAQAREAQIEAALERVRSRSLAMRKSEELGDLSLELVKQVQELGVATWFCAFNINEDETGSVEWGSNGQGIFPRYRTPREGVFLEYHEAGQRGETLYIKEIGENECPAHYEYLCSLPGVGDQLLAMKADGIPFPKSQIDHVVFFKYGYLLFITFEPAPEAHDIFKRFGKVFEQTYTRFLDLQKAEAQAHEAQIEAALERVRSRTMGMQKSDELPQAAILLFQQIQSLGIPVWSTAFNILSDDERSVACNVSSEGQLQPSFRIPLTEEQSLKEWHEAVQRNDPLFVQELGGSKLEKHYKYLFTLPGVNQAAEPLEEAGIELPTHQVNHLCRFSHGFLCFITYEQVPDAHHIFERFTQLFEQTYTRFLDLKKAESRAREAQIESGLERVRSCSLSMQSTTDLQQVVDMVFVELNKLAIGMDHTAIVTLLEDSKDYDVWVGSADANFTTVSRIPYNQLTRVQRDYNEMIQNRPSFLSKTYCGDVKKEYSQYLFSQTGFKNNTPEKELRLMMDGDTLITSIAMLENTGIQIVSYSDNGFSESDEAILSRFANVFEQAYIRFMDIKKSEEQAVLINREKERLEKTLLDLQSAQAQLIHSEKMASLGELTAGIAHEIKNPLNFVNNFSEVSQELLEELEEEIAAGNLDEVRDLVNDLVGNLEKIRNHGQRADGIVRSMLQHSRGGAGEKLPTDLNILADEYVRLAYHGLRAKDKSFNAEFEINVDGSLPKVHVVPQDVGRVLLNLINNAFYAVNQKKQESRDGQYRPLVRVHTQSEGAVVRITVSDNGNGVPQEIVDKIFQPFFTTKPTGEGTGLGLSLSYDIVKVHGGDMKVVTNEGTGSEFIIELPIADEDRHAGLT